MNLVDRLFNGNSSGGGVTPSGTISITENGEGIDVSSYAYADVNVSGGGSSDFTTAEVTVIGTTKNSFAMPFAIEEGALGEGSPACIYAPPMGWDSGTYTVVLYKGSTVVEFFDDVTTSGNITNLFDATYVVTGDCTITFND